MSIDDAVAFAVEDRLPSQAMTVVKPKTEIRLTKRELEIARLIAQGDDQPRHRDQALHLGANGRGACHQHDPERSSA